MCLLPLLSYAQPFLPKEIAAYERYADKVTIVRDQWGIPHVYGKTDADAVFGLMYAQCEDDFKRVELNYIEKLGRLSEVNGEKDLYNDLQIRLLIDSNVAIDAYRKAAPWLRKLMDAYAAGINFYLYKNPQTKPALLTRFEPWYPFLWTDGSIGAINTSNLSLAELRRFYTQEAQATNDPPVIKDQQSGSNGFAFAPSITEKGHAILYLNPHTTFYFRPEVQMQSEEGLNVYGAVTWGQFFIYQGFNEFCGWMHTSNNVDVTDMYAVDVFKKGKDHYYLYDGKQRKVTTKTQTFRYLENGELKTRTFTTYYTLHGPVMAKRDGKWVSLKHKNQYPDGLVQSWLRTKARSFEDYKKAMDLKANASNNTVYADKEGNIAYWHGNFIPVRNPDYDWSKVMDGHSSATAWKGLHPVSETVHIYNPPNGWLQNCNSTPFTAAGKYSPRKSDFPSYMAPDGENFRGVAALRLFEKPEKYTLEKVIAFGYDTYLPAFELLIPALVKAYAQLPATHPQKEELNESVQLLKEWDYYADTASIATTLAMEWAPRLSPLLQRVYVDPLEKDQVSTMKAFVKSAEAAQLLHPLQAVLEDLTKRFGQWQVPWGAINRFQRLTGQVQESYDDEAPSFAVAYGSGTWGQLPSYRSAPYQTRKRYGTSGNSFVCAVEFGDRIQARSLLAGGNSGQAGSPHLNDQAEMYSKGQFKEVLFYKEDVLQHAQKTYRPGD